MHNTWTNRGWPRILLLFAGLLLSSTTSFAHPMGNFSINHYAKIKVGHKSIEIRYLIDMAEIPAFQEMRQFDMTPIADDPGVNRYLDSEEQKVKLIKKFRKFRRKMKNHIDLGCWICCNC